MLMLKLPILDEAHERVIHSDCLFVTSAGNAPLDAVSISLVFEGDTLNQKFHQKLFSDFKLNSHKTELLLLNKKDNYIQNRPKRQLTCLGITTTSSTTVFDGKPY